jgi:hypothetical protein
MGDADYVSVSPGQQDRFAVLQHYRDGSRIEITVHKFDDPDHVLASITISGTVRVGREAFTGNLEEWRFVPSAYVSFYRPSLRSGEYRLIVIDRRQATANTQRFGWFDERFDHMYQAPTHAVAVPPEFYGDVDPAISLCAVAVSRDSNLYLYGAENDRLYRVVPLRGRRGGRPPIFRTTAPEAWLSDYDALVRLDPRSWTVTAQRSLQSPINGVAMFVGNIALTPDEKLCVVPRPGSGDMIAIDTNTFSTVASARLGLQPLEAAALQDGRIFARDWKTGSLLAGRLEAP